MTSVKLTRAERVQRRAAFAKRIGLFSPFLPLDYVSRTDALLPPLALGPDDDPEVARQWRRKRITAVKALDEFDEQITDAMEEMMKAFAVEVQAAVAQIGQS